MQTMAGDLARDKVELSANVQSLADKITALKPLKSEVEALKRQVRVEQDATRTLRDQVQDWRIRCEQHEASLNLAQRQAAAKVQHVAAPRPPPPSFDKHPPTPTHQHTVFFLRPVASCVVTN